MRPLVGILNRASGGPSGARLAAGLQAAAIPVHDLAAGFPAALGATPAGALVLAIGGDGTVVGALEAVRAAGRGDLQVVPAPAGTGNDLARHLGWFPGSDDAGTLLAGLEQGAPAALDRWRLIGPGIDRAFINYWSAGYDAEVALRFHRLRQRRRALVSWLGRSAYVLVGAATPAPALDERLVAERRLPTGTASLVLASIPSYAAGVRLAADMDAGDGLCEMVSLPGGVAAGLALAGALPRPLLGRGRSWRFRLREPLAMQADGEPFMAPPGRYAVAWAGQVAAWRRAAP